MEEDLIKIMDKKGNLVDLPFEAIEQLYGELGLSPGYGSPRINERGCTCAIGVVDAAGLKNPYTNLGVCSIFGVGFDRGAMHGAERTASERLGAYFRRRLPPGETLPSARDCDLGEDK